MTTSSASHANPTTSIKKVRKAVLPAAGLGTRFLPATKAQPKEMLTVVDKPQIQYVVEECVVSGIEHVIIVTGKGKNSIEDHFDYNPTLERFLEEKGKKEQAALVRQISDMVQVSYTRQKEPLGLGHAVLCARAVVGNEPFAVILADDLIDADVPVLKQMIDIYDKEQRSVIAVQPIPPEDSQSYGIIKGEKVGDRLYRMTGIVEKPHPDVAPSNLAVVGRYILSAAVLDLLNRHPELSKISVEGHTDNRGPLEHNLRLSELRARSVVKWLVQHGVDAFFA